MTNPADPLAPAFYAVLDNQRRNAWTDWWLLFHPPYTLWHLSYVAIGASIAPRFDGGRLTATLIAFLLAVGVGAHALDELHGHPLHTAISDRVLITAAAVSLSGAVAIGVIGLDRVGPGLLVFIVLGIVLDCGYNLELVGGRFHNGITFSLAWGAFPVLTAYFAQAGNLRPVAVLAAFSAAWLAAAQRSLSTPARALRRRTVSVDGTVVFRNGQTTTLSRSALLAPIEAALKCMVWGVVALAVTLVVYRAT